MKGNQGRTPGALGGGSAHPSPQAGPQPCGHRSLPVGGLSQGPHGPQVSSLERREAGGGRQERLCGQGPTSQGASPAASSLKVTHRPPFPSDRNKQERRPKGGGTGNERLTHNPCVWGTRSFSGLVGPNVPLPHGRHWTPLPPTPIILPSVRRAHVPTVSRPSPTATGGRRSARGVSRPQPAAMLSSL